MYEVGFGNLQASRTAKEDGPVISQLKILGKKEAEVGLMENFPPGQGNVAVGWAHEEVCILSTAFTTLVNLILR